MVVSKSLSNQEVLAVSASIGALERNLSKKI